MPSIILASTSPRRQELLAQVGLKFTVVPSGYTEALTPGLDPHELARRTSAGKARQVVPRLTSYRDAIIIAADTFGVYRGQILGKPQSDEEAKQMLARLSGHWHRVITGFTIIAPGSGQTLTRTVDTKVHFRKLTPKEIDAYVASGEARDKAAAYAIQGHGALLVDKIVGDYFNVVGLPLAALAEALKEFGIRLL